MPSNFIDLTGCKFGKVTVIGIAEKPAHIKSRNIFWHCECECGRFLTVPSGRLKTTKGCGCVRSPSLLGERFSHLIVEATGDNIGKCRSWVCKCDCGNTISATTSNLRGGRVQSCGCIVGSPLDLTSKRYGRLLVLEKTGDRKNRSIVWKCQCDCGKVVEVSAGRILYNGVRSCGCMRFDSGAQDSNWRGCGEISGAVWTSIKKSATKRGISVNISIQEAWDLFLSQDKKCKLSGVVLDFGLDRTASLDRIDSLKAYEPGNIQWVHKVVNIMKWCLSQDEFISWCTLISNNKDCCYGPSIIHQYTI